ncbi:MAG: glycosyltransferase family 4 protein [Pleurocapsa sp.]
MHKPVLTIFYQFNPWRSSIGGIQTIIRSFIKYAPDNFDIRLVGTGDLDCRLGVWQEAEFEGTKLQFMPILALENDDIRTLIPTTIKYTLALIGKDLSADFLHFHRLEPSSMAFGWKGEKTLFVHNDIQTQMDASNSKDAILWKRFPKIYFALEKYLLHQFDLTYNCHTESVKFYQQLYPQISDKFLYLKNTVDSEIFQPLNIVEREQKRQGLAVEFNLPLDTRFILFAGRLHPQKDPFLLVRSFANLHHFNIHLLIAGKGELADELQAEIDLLGLTDRVTMLGPVEQRRLAALHHASSIFVLSSVYEGLPVAVLEALCSGTPVVTTNCGETPNFLTKDSGIVCQERSVSAMSAALATVLLNPQQYPPDACTRTASPYKACNVVNGVYESMWQRWQQRQHN